MSKKLIILLFSSTVAMGFVNQIHASNVASESTGILEDDNKSERFELYPTENVGIFLRLDKMTGCISLVQWSLESSKEFTMVLNDQNLATLSSVGNCFKLYPTKNMFQFLLLDQSTGNMWHVQWGFKDGENWIKKIY